MIALSSTSKRTLYYAALILPLFNSTTSKTFDYHDKVQLFANEFKNGLRMMKKNQYNNALNAFKKALLFDPQSAETYFNIGIIHLKKNEHRDAINAFENSVQRNEKFTKAYLNLATLYEEQKNREKTIWAYRKLIELEPANGNYYLALARTLKENGNTNDAIPYYRKAMEIDPQDLVLKAEVGNLLCSIDRHDEALRVYREIIEKEARSLPVLIKIAHVLRYQGKMKEALAFYNRVINELPNDEHIRYGLAESYLALGNFEKGWAYFSSHWKRSPDTRNFSEKYWDGSNVNGKKILLRAEYGQGDTMQFIRYAQLLKKHGAYVIAEVQHSLVPLLRLCPYLDEVIPVIDEHSKVFPEFDVQIPIMNLPYRFRTTEKTIPANIPYLEADPNLVKAWANKTIRDKQFKIGICWQTSPYFESFKTPPQKKSIPLEEFVPLFQINDISFYSLQVPCDKREIDSLPIKVTLHTYADFDNRHGRFMDTAALIQNLDLVITVDTSVAHLAGALGKPVFVLLPQAADWRWMQNRTDSPWYPTMHLFRQNEVGNWADVILQVTEMVKKISQNKDNITSIISESKTTATPVLAEISLGELIDKITILQIKDEQLKDGAQLRNVRTELETLQERLSIISSSSELEKLTNELREVNKKLWVIEDAIREKERAKTFDQKFIELARSVYFTNDRRCEIKRAINKLLGSRLIEEKSYTDYKPA